MDIPSTSSGISSKRSPKEAVRLGSKDFEKRVMEWYLESDDELDDNMESEDSDTDPDYVLSDEEQQATQDEVEISEESDNSETEDELLQGEQVIGENNDNQLDRGSNGENQFFIGRKNKKEYKWLKNAPPVRKTPKHNIIRQLPGLTRKATRLDNPDKLELWKCLFDKHMIEKIVLYTNAKLVATRNKLNPESNKSNYRNTDSVEIHAYIGLLMLASIFKSGHENMKSLFSKGLTGRPIFRATMSVKRFEILGTALRFDDSTTREERRKSDRAAPISEIFNAFIQNSQEMYCPSDNVTVDEMLVPFRGKCGFRMYMPKKPAKYGIKIQCLADSYSTYLFNAYIYTGKDSDGIGLSTEERKLLKPTQSVLRLCKPLQGSNRNITADNWFTSLELVEELRKRSITYVGTMKLNKAVIPPEFRAHKSRPMGSAIYGFSADMPATLVSIVPKINKSVVLISSMHDKIETNPDKNKPEIVCYYNKTKSGVDLLDMKSALYSSNRRTRRWPLVIFYTLINVSCVNSFILYLCYRQNPTIKRRDFIESLAMSLIEPHLRRRIVIPNLPRDIKSLIREVIPQEPEDPTDEVPSDKLQKRKTCSKCPPRKERKTAYKCIRCGDAICLECSRKVCINCAITGLNI